MGEGEGNRARGLLYSCMKHLGMKFHNFSSHTRDNFCMYEAYFIHVLLKITSKCSVPLWVLSLEYTLYQ